MMMRRTRKTMTVLTMMSAICKVCFPRPKICRICLPPAFKGAIISTKSSQGALSAAKRDVVRRRKGQNLSIASAVPRRVRLICAFKCKSALFADLLNGRFFCMSEAVKQGAANAATAGERKIAPLWKRLLFPMCSSSVRSRTSSPISA